VSELLRLLLSLALTNLGSNSTRDNVLFDNRKPHFASNKARRGTGCLPPPLKLKNLYDLIFYMGLTFIQPTKNKAKKPAEKINEYQYCCFPWRYR
jgi:hypothetical protein